MVALGSMLQLDFLSIVRGNDHDRERGVGVDVLSMLEGCTPLPTWTQSMDCDSDDRLATPFPLISNCDQANACRQSWETHQNPWFSMGFSIFMTFYAEKLQKSKKYSSIVKNAKTLY